MPNDDREDAAAFAELRRLRTQIIAAVFLIPSPFILLILITLVSNSFVTVTLGSNWLWALEAVLVGLVLGSSHILGGLEDDILLIYIYLAFAIGLGSIFPLAGLRQALKEQMGLGRGYTMIFSRPEKLKLILPWWLIFGGVTSAFAGLGVMTSGTEGILADFTFTGLLISGAAFIGGIVASTVGFFLARRNSAYVKSRSSP